jgi:antirestriction protein ArdC
MDIYGAVTQKIIDALEAGTVPWKKPWRNGSQRNFISKRPYSGINIFLLELQNRSTPYWLTFKQVGDLGGMVKKGEHGTNIIYAANVSSKEIGEDGEEHKKSYFMLRGYYVWNLDQTDGIEIPAEGEKFEPIAKCEEIVAGYHDRGPAFMEGGDRACYSPSGDYIKMPFKNTFLGEPQYYSTVFHEMTHSTGHEKRLNRETLVNGVSFGSEVYSKEELVAEIGASFLMGIAGIEDNQAQSASYIAGWLKALNNDKKLVVSAAAQAQKAADYILNK